LAFVLMLTAGAGRAADAQIPAFSDPQVSGPAPAGQAATLTYANRPVVELRAQVLTRMPAERAAAAAQTLDKLVARGVTSPVSTRRVGDAIAILVGDEMVVAIVPADVDFLAGETIESTAIRAAGRLLVALEEAEESRAPRRLVWASAQALGITVVLCALLWLIRRLERGSSALVRRAAERQSGPAWGGEAMRVTRLPQVMHRLATFLLRLIAMVLVYLWFAFVLRRFPYTRPWGESLRELLLAQLAGLGAGFIRALPGLLTVAIIILISRWASKAVRLLFDAVQQGRLSLPGVHRDTALLMRRLVLVLVWLFAAALAYPHVPGSESAGFKGISIFVGVILSLGSTSVVQHLMSGLVLTFSRAVHVGDFARIGDVEGTVVQLGALAMKVRTPYGEEVTIPNAVVVSQTATNYSDVSATRAAFLATSVTIGYDTPWRQVEALLLIAAQSTPGVRQTTRPVVLRTALEDYYIKYTLLVLPEDPCRRIDLLDQIHARILDVFNEYNVQIMSPHYVTDPSGAKVVPRGQWFAPPASPAGTADRAPAADGSLPS
jgi:small-conductance mechanosensitive channel